MPLFIHWRLPRAATTGHRSLSTATRAPVSSNCRIGRRWAGAGAVGGVERRELRGRRAQHPDRDGTCDRGHRRSLALTFRTGGMPLFIHWRLPRAATTGHRSLSTATRWRPVSSLPDRGDDGPAGGRRRRAPRATGSACATPRSRRHLREGSPPLSRSDISDWRDATLYPLAAAARRDDRPSVAQHSDPLASCFVDLPDRGDDGPALVRSAASSAASYGVGVRNTPIATAPARGVTAALSL